ncbi:hypothetical protein KBW71_03235 [Hydrogenophaga aromaticivorans]|uniref:hypothetical protein n=1 Tax=Hydrogenophaga aromaticivorans TaxID=2610898 RepID=UPI001B386E1F|nr:hypothetical protein [Hydrogenophaga aromaticivorans]MBQ0917442.1 hypothetical protein [Hydrogenophaga aromaticivorans]
MHGQDGEPEPGASFEFRLNRYEVYEGFVVPEIMRGVADETGSCVLDLWPNQLGTTESVYDVTMRSTTGKTQRITASVPAEAAANLHDIAMLPPYPGKPDFQAQMDAAIEAKQSAVAAMDTTLEARDVTLAARDAAQSSEDDATAQAVIATTQAGIATTKAAEAAASAVTAATFDPALFVPKAGGVTMTGTLAVPAGATGSNVPRASEVVPLAGGVTMTGTLAVPAGASGSNVPRASEVALLVGATFTGAVAVPAGASGAQVPQAQEVLLKTGGTATGHIEVPAGATVAQVMQAQEVVALVETAKIKDQTTVATTSGTSIDITGIPAGIKRLVVRFLGVGTSGTTGKKLQLGTSAGVDTTGNYVYNNYRTNAANIAGSGSTTATGFVDADQLSTTRQYGTYVLELADAATNTWTVTGLVVSGATQYTISTSGAKALPGALDRIRLTTGNGTDTFTAGSISLSWEF